MSAKSWTKVRSWHWLRDDRASIVFLEQGQVWAVTLPYGRGLFDDQGQPARFISAEEAMAAVDALDGKVCG